MNRFVLSLTFAASFFVLCISPVRAQEAELRAFGLSAGCHSGIVARERLEERLRRYRAREIAPPAEAPQGARAWRYPGAGAMTMLLPSADECRVLIGEANPERLRTVMAERLAEMSGVVRSQPADPIVDGRTQDLWCLHDGEGDFAISLDTWTEARDGVVAMVYFRRVPEGFQPCRASRAAYVESSTPLQSAEQRVLRAIDLCTYVIDDSDLLRRLQANGVTRMEHESGIEAWALPGDGGILIIQHSADDCRVVAGDVDPVLMRRIATEGLLALPNVSRGLSEDIALENWGAIDMFCAQRGDVRGGVLVYTASARRDEDMDVLVRVVRFREDSPRCPQP